MATVQTSNFLPEMQHLLDVQGEDSTATALEVLCACCNENLLDISRSARVATALGTSPSKRPVTERTVAFPCGHVIGDRCFAQMLTASKPQKHATCPSCDYRMTYERCGHPIAPALIPVRDAAAEVGGSVRDRFPLTIPEGGPTPDNCKECRWNTVSRRASISLGVDCAVCRQREVAGLPHSEGEHEKHHAEHLTTGLRSELEGIMKLVWPDFETRETQTSAETATAHSDRRQAMVSVLVAMALSELEETIWVHTPSHDLSKELAKKHHAAIHSIKENLLSWLMESPEDSRRTW